uniref:Uncharacterized protein n=1 Tax=Anguilla anguilla TaxID=7936 RepID=A0A0E9XHJ3_ANGAN
MRMMLPAHWNFSELMNRIGCFTLGKISSSSGNIQESKAIPHLNLSSLQRDSITVAPPKECPIIAIRHMSREFSNVVQSNRDCSTFVTEFPELISVRISSAFIHSSALCFTCLFRRGNSLSPVFRDL